LHEGKDVRAVKAVREALGLSLLDAKQYVDAIKKEMDEKK
jgi:ribosomal protein L7/L12